MSTRVAVVAPLSLLTFLLSSAASQAFDQPQWGERYTRNMVSPEVGLPETFDPKTNLNIKWSVALGTSTHSTPVIGGGRVLIGSNNGRPRDAKHQGDRGVLMCFDEKDGRFLWQLLVSKRVPSLYWDWPHAGICSPATIEGRRAYLVSNRGEVLCLDLDGLANGNDGPYTNEARHATPDGSEPIALTDTDADILWLFDVTGQLGVRQHDAAHSSILLDGDYLYVNTSNGVDDTHKKIAAPDAPSLIVIDKRSGRVVAMDDEHIGPRIFHSTWSSPALAEVNGQPAIIFCGGDGVIYAFEPVTANPSSSSPAKLKRIWRFDCDPTGPKENVHRYNSNRKESPSNIKSMPVFHQGRLYVTVGGDLWWGKEQAWLKCIDPNGRGDITRTAERWSYPLEKHSMSTPAVHQGLLFVGDSGRRVHCVDARTGEPYWTHDGRGEFWASPLVADGKVYLGTQRGDFWVFAASKEKKVLASLDLDGAISASVVAANGVLYVATMKTLYAIAKSN